MRPSRAKVGVLISGRGSNLAALIEASRAAECPYDVVLVAANDPGAPGLEIARSRSIPTFAMSHKGIERAVFDAAVDGALRNAGVEWVALAGYMRLLTAGFTDAWAGRIVNIHPSLLPDYKGLDTHARVLADGATRHGCTVHVVTSALDDGPIVAQAEVPVLAGDTTATLSARVLEAEHRLYPQALADLILGHHEQR